MPEHNGNVAVETRPAPVKSGEIKPARREVPDLFSQTLQIDLNKDIEESLARVGARQAELRGLRLNWVVTFEHAACTFIKHMELQAERGLARI